VNPVYLHEDAARALVGAAVALWAVTEAYLRWRNRAARRELEWSFFAVLGSIAAGLVLAFRLEHVDATVIDGWVPVIAGVAILLAGAAFRIWAIVVLGRFFTVTVTIQPDHRIVEDGPYRRLRHPSYTGLLAALAGFGLALGNWLSLLALVVLPLAGVLLRIRAEEAALVRALGDGYRAYEARTDRLIPGVW
jgi:protein-S-isoprenylcysteine O-methyltransferase Ste14